MIYAFIRLWATIFLRLYFRKTIIYGRDQVPMQGPLILASNHPSAFLEASLLGTVMKRPVHYLVRGDMFHPRFRWLFDWTKQIPIYRQKDGIANLRKNASSFDLTYRKLSEGESVLIFPEAKTTLEKKMRPIQRGTAHLAFGTMPFLKNGETLNVQPVGVNFTEPRLPGTDVVIRFGQPFSVANNARENREAIESFTEQLSAAMSPLIIQVDDQLEKNYDVLAAIYFRLLIDNKPDRNAHDDLQKIAGEINRKESNSLIERTNEVYTILKKLKNPDAAYFPDLIILNRVGLAVMFVLKCIWLLGGGWIWRLVRNMIFSKIKTNTFQSPTSVGAFMVVMPLVTIILLVIFLLTGVPAYFVLIWMFVMWIGTLIRPSFHVIYGLLMMSITGKVTVKKIVLQLKNEVDHIIG